jgi:hypothetical protein
MGGACLAWAREALSGSAAVDERSEGPSCVLSAVENRHDTRVLYEVLDHDATQTDIEALLGRVKTALDARGVARKGLTTDGSALYPEPIRIVCGDVPHQLCPFPRIKDLTKGVLKAVATERERVARSTPTLPRGRPSSTEQAARRRARTRQSLRQKIRDVFQERSLLVKRRWKASERQRRMSITRGLPHLRKLREIMEHMYALFDRRCRTQKALDTREKLRQWVQRFTWIGDTFKKVFSPHLEQALTFLDDTLLPATSNAVERGNRRHRKRQKRVYRVRSTIC